MYYSVQNVNMKRMKFWFIELIEGLLWHLLLVAVVVVKGRHKPPGGTLMHHISGLGHLLHIRKNLELLRLHFGSWGPVTDHGITTWGQRRTEPQTTAIFAQANGQFGFASILVCLSLDDGGSWRAWTGTWTERRQLWELNHWGHFMFIILKLFWNVFCLFVFEYLVHCYKDQYQVVSNKIVWKQANCVPNGWNTV